MSFVNQLKKRAISFLGDLTMKVTDTVITEIIMQICEIVKKGAESRRSLKEIIYEALLKNRHVYAALIYLPEQAKDALIETFSDQRVREWLHANIDDALDYLVFLIKQTKVPKPEV